MATTTPAKMVLHCDHDGRVVQTDAQASAWLASHGGPRAEPQAATRAHCHSLPMLVDRASASKCERFLQRVRTAGAAFGWELHAVVAGRLVTLLFAGLQQSEHQLLVAIASTHRDLLKLLDETVARAADGVLAASALHTDMEPRASPVDLAHCTLDELTRVNSDLVSLQRELAKRNAELTAITKQRNQLLATAAHDLRNPILVVQGYCDLLGMAADPAGGRQGELVGQVQRASELMLHVIEDTLEYASLETGKVHPRRRKVALAELVQHCADSYRSMATRKGIELEVRYGAPVPPLELDASNIERVIGNLLSNAIKFSEPGSKVAVELTRRNGHAVLAVIDTGPGIAEAEVPLLFRPFQTASARPTAGESSTGLGLAIVRQLIEANGGEISVRSRLQEGSTFEARFPIPQTKRAKSSRPPARLPTHSESRATTRQPNINVRPGRTRKPH